MVLMPAALCASFSALGQSATTTPITNVIVLFQENESFDHYFGTYPNATNGDSTYGSNIGSSFTAYPGTPTVNGLTPELLHNNPNLNAAGTAHVNPTRLAPANAMTCSMNHNYGPEQLAEDSGFMDKFIAYTSTNTQGCMSDGSTVLAYFDGNTVTALWNYAQNYALNDNSYGSTFGPSTTGALNLIAGQTYGGITHFGTGSTASYPNTVTNPVTDIGDFDPYLDDCGNDKGGTLTGTTTLEMSNGTTNNNKNIGDLLNAAGVTWGWFQGGFAPTSPAVYNSATGTWTPAVCNTSRAKHSYPSGPSAGVFYTQAQVEAGQPGLVVAPNPASPFVTGSDIHGLGADYVAHHEPFQFYASTRNPHHLPPTSISAVGTASDQANHQYDTAVFFQALAAGTLPAVSFIKAPYAYNAHPSNSDPLAEQYWITQVINQVMQSSYWPSTAIIIAYDDSDGWADHQMAPIVSPSDVTITGQAIAYDNIGGVGVCGTAVAGTNPARCGHGPRLPLLVISPWANSNFVDHTLTDQTSIIAFIEQNWSLGYIDGPTAPTPLVNASFDRFAGTLDNMFNFSVQPNTSPLLLTCQGALKLSRASARLNPWSDMMHMNRRTRTAIIGAAALAATSLATLDARASTVTLSLGSEYNDAYILNYFLGGADSVPSDGSGPNLGFGFSNNAVVEKSGTASGYGKYQNNPSSQTEVLVFAADNYGGTLNTGGSYLNFSQGFSGISFNYALSANNAEFNGTADIWSGLNGTGSLLGSIALSATGAGNSCTTAQYAYCNWSSVSASSFGTAESITFGGTSTSDYAEFSGVQVTAVPLPAAAWLLLSGAAGLVGFSRKARCAV
jgi:phospholipase C